MVLFNPLGPHAARHEWPGDDKLDIRRLFVNLQMIHSDWVTRDAWTDVLTGSASITWGGPGRVTMATGATAGSRAATHTGLCGLSPHSGDRPWVVKLQNDGAGSFGDTLRIYALRSGGAIPPVDGTDVYIGFRREGTRWHAVHCDGSNPEEDTDTGLDMDTDYGGASVSILGGDGTTAYFYIGATLVATHTVNLPAEWNYREYFDIYNEASAIDRSIRIAQSAYAAGAA